MAKVGYIGKEWCVVEQDFTNETIKSFAANLVEGNTTAAMTKLTWSCANIEQ